MEVYVCFSQETGSLGTEYLYRGTETSLPQCVRYLKPSSKFDPATLTRETRPEDNKHYFIIPDGDDRYLIIFEDKLKGVETVEEVEEKKTVKVTRIEPDKPSKLGNPGGSITIKI